MVTNGLYVFTSGVLASVAGGAGYIFGEQDGKEDGYAQARGEFRYGHGWDMGERTTMDLDIPVGEHAAISVSADDQRLLSVAPLNNQPFDLFVMAEETYQRYQDNEEWDGELQHANYQFDATREEIIVPPGDYRIVFDNTVYGSQPNDAVLEIDGHYWVGVRSPNGSQQGPEFNEPAPDSES